MVAEITIRPIRADDAAAVSAFLKKLTALGKRRMGDDVDFVLSHYVNDADILRTSVAVGADGVAVGLQVIIRAAEGNAYGVTPGWGSIGTHVDPDAAGQGIGRKLFSETERVAITAGLEKINATIGADNPEGLAYYEAMGFRTYRSDDERVWKCFEVAKTG